MALVSASRGLWNRSKLSRTRKGRGLVLQRATRLCTRCAGGAPAQRCAREVTVRLHGTVQVAAKERRQLAIEREAAGAPEVVAQIQEKQARAEEHERTIANQNRPFYCALCDKQCACGATCACRGSTHTVHTLPSYTDKSTMEMQAHLNSCTLHASAPPPASAAWRRRAHMLDVAAHYCTDLPLPHVAYCLPPDIQTITGIVLGLRRCVTRSAHARTR